MKRFNLVLFIAVIFIFSACQKKQKTIYDFKTDFVGDNSKVSQIINMQAYPKNFQTSEIKILSEKEPYGLKVFCKNYKNLEKKDLFKNAATTLALIKNLDNLYYVDENEREIFTYNRKEVEENLKKENTSLEKISESKENLENFINN